MPDDVLAARVRHELQALMHLLPLLTLAVICALLLVPTWSTLASTHFQSPVSPLSPIRKPPTVLPPTAKHTSVETATARPTAAPAATLAIETPVEQEETPPPPPVVLQSASSTPPTLWILLGLAVVGALVGALLFFRRG